ncbi:MAG: hypothetical protein IKK22_04785, partial [Firmicutes bacterium]|nr:hypothetical protein [Bacillota bacterium]
MATKLKNTNKKLLQMILIPLCAALFVGALHFGSKAVLTVVDSGFSERLLNGGTYIDSGEIVSDLRYDFQTVMNRSYGNIGYYSDPQTNLLRLGDQNVAEIKTKAELREAYWEEITEDLDGIEQYELMKDRVFHIKLGDRIYKSENYQEWSSKVAASITITADRTSAGGELANREEDSLYSYMEHGLQNALYEYRSMDETLEGNMSPLQGEDLEVFIGYPKNYLADREEQFKTTSEQFREDAYRTLICAGATLVLFVFLCIMTGEKDEEGSMVIRGLDLWPTELFCIAI